VTDGLSRCDPYFATSAAGVAGRAHRWGSRVPRRIHPELAAARQRQMAEQPPAFFQLCALIVARRPTPALHWLPKAG
jgi:hypothetical protein